jgi:MFS family permease
VVLETVTAVQLLIVVTIMPVVVRDLGGLRFYGWAFSAATIAAMVALPATGRLADRWGSARALVLVLVTFLAGTVVAGTATSMLVFVAGRFLQGWGLGASYAVSLGAVAKTYPERYRSRIIALVSAAWVIPSVIGPPVGALLATTVGWRWAFFVSLPIAMVAVALALPELRDIPAPEHPETGGARLGSLILLAVGACAILGGLAAIRWWSIPIVLAGFAALIPALRRLLPEGSLTAKPGLPAGVAAGFLLSFAFFGIDGFVPLLLTRIRGQSVAVAGVVVTFSGIAWSLATFWQSKATSRWSRGALVALGAALIVVGGVAVWSAVSPSVPLFVPYLGWFVAGAGMGISWPTIPLVAMEQAPSGRQTSTIAAVSLSDTFGAALGPGLGGTAVAVAAVTATSLAVGLSGAFALAILAGLTTLLVATRLPGRPVVAPTGDGPPPVDA